MAIGLTVLAIIAIGGVTAAIVVLPLRLPWPKRLRWLVATATTPDVLAPTTPAIDLAEVHVAMVDDAADGIHLWLEAARAREWVHVRAVLAPGSVARATVAAWWRDRTPLLCVDRRDGELSLHAPGATIAAVRVDVVDIVPSQPATRCEVSRA